MRRAGAAVLLVAAACAVSPRVGSAPRPHQRNDGVIDPARFEAAVAAYRAGLMPLHATAVDLANELHPDIDGRGVIIAILDSGIDPSVAGLQRTSDGGVKLLDLRDFSGEGRIELQPSAVRQGCLHAGRHTLCGADALAQRPVWVGRVPERRWGAGPGADLDGNGVVGDTLLVVVSRGPTGTVALVDTDLDGRLDDEVPYEDFARRQQWFGWSRDSSRPPPIGVAVNLSDDGLQPQLDLVFDADGHGTRVAGIAAGHDLHGVTGFDGVAPGARLLGMKIAARGLGGVTTSGALLAAVNYAIATADRYDMPLVINLSFGIGSGGAGTSAIDQAVDRILAAHPAVVMTVAAGNDGPGLGTIGVPARAERVIAVGATAPLVFAGVGPSRHARDPMASYSSRGGRYPGPELVAPGTAWSAVPRFLSGREEGTGTSMAAPHVAGLAARLATSMVATGRPVDRLLIRRALSATAHPIPFAAAIDQGAGVPDMVAAEEWLSRNDEVPVLAATAPDGSSHDALWFDGPVLPERLTVDIARRDRAEAMRLRLWTTVPWLRVEAGREQELPVAGRRIALRLDPEALLTPGIRSGTLLVADADHPERGVVLRVPVTISHPIALGVAKPTVVTMQPGETAREAVVIDSGRALQLHVESLSRQVAPLVVLHRNDGRTIWRSRVARPGSDAAEVTRMFDGGNVSAGRYQLAVVAPGTRSVAARMTVRQSPVRVDAAAVADSVMIGVSNPGSQPVGVRLAAELIGTERVSSIADDEWRPRRLALAVPRWADRLVVDVEIAAALWQRLSDMGITVRDRAGAWLAGTAMSYGVGRLRLALPPQRETDSVYVVLAPAAVDTAGMTGWQARLRLRFERATPVAVMLHPAQLRLAPGERAMVAAPWDRSRAEAVGSDHQVLRLRMETDDGVVWQRTLVPGRGEGEP